jgi:HD-GYP domain-containing protein (c-di-GMP phosphodiesterase class II)
VTSRSARSRLYVSSSRVYSRTAYPPDVTLRYMLKRSGTYYDPVLMKIFVNGIGVIPIGTLFLLNSRELAVVVQANPDPEKWKAPKV